MKCSRCGCVLDKSQPSWRLEVKIWADIPDIPAEFQKNTDELDDLIKQSLQRIKYLDRKAIENEVHRILEFRLCRDCRDIFLANPLNKSLD